MFFSKMLGSAHRKDPTGKGKVIYDLFFRDNRKYVCVIEYECNTLIHLEMIVYRVKSNSEVEIESRYDLCPFKVYKNFTEMKSVTSRALYSELVKLLGISNEFFPA